MVSVCAKTSPEHQQSELLPGINDEITLNHITPKLSWRDFYILSSVSQGWCHAIQTRQVYDARVRQGTVEKLVLIQHENVTLHKQVNVITLYSMRDHSFYQLPPLSKFEEGRGCVTLDGKVYVFLCDGEVYVMDLAGQRKWTQCASRGKSVQSMKCDVVHGEIYVVDDSCDGAPEVFDPMTNSWSVIKNPPTKPRGLSHFVQVRTVGDELFICYDHILQVYNPAKAEWREFRDSPVTHAPFSRHGKFHGFHKPQFDEFTLLLEDPDYFTEEVMTFDGEKSSWTNLCSCWFEVLAETNSVGVEVVAVLAVDDDELLTIVNWLEIYQSGDYGDIIGCDLLRSVGFGSHGSEMDWHIVEGSYSMTWPLCWTGWSMSSIEV